jgi:hypothetical protein
MEVGYIDRQPYCIEVLCHSGIAKGVQPHPDRCGLSSNHSVAEDLGNTDLC